MRAKIYLLLAVFSLNASLAFADAQSTNFKLESNFSSGGGAASGTSTNFKIEEGNIDWTEKANLSSSTYKVDSAIGTSGAPPVAVIQSITPADYTRFYTDQSASFVVTAVSPDNDPLQYEAKQDGVSKAGPQPSCPLTWPFTLSDKGKHTIDLSATEQHGTVTASRKIYVMRKPVK